MVGSCASQASTGHRRSARCVDTVSLQLNVPRHGRPTGEVTDLLQQLIRNACVNDGSASVRPARRGASTLLQPYLDGRGARHRALRAVTGTRRASCAASKAPTRRADVAAHGSHRRRAGERGRLATRSVRWRARIDGQRCGARRGRHAEPHRVDGRRDAPAGRRRASDPTARSSTSPSPTRRRSAPTAPSTSSTTQRDDVRADYVITEAGGFPLPSRRPARSCRSSSARRARTGARCGCAARLATRRSPTAPTTPWSQRPRWSAGWPTFRPPTVLHDIWRRFLDGMGCPEEIVAPLLDRATLRSARSTRCRSAWPASSTPARTRPSPRRSCTAGRRRTSSPTPSTSSSTSAPCPARSRPTCAACSTRRSATSRDRVEIDRRPRRPVDGVADRDAAVGHDRARRCTRLLPRRRRSCRTSPSARPTPASSAGSADGVRLRPVQHRT